MRRISSSLFPRESTLISVAPTAVCKTGCYKKLAAVILADLCCCRMLMNVENDISVRVQQDGEVVFIKWRGEKPSDSILREQLAESLEDYMKHAAAYKTPKKLIDAVPCLKLIILRRDEEANKIYPASYKKLKGKPLNPIQVAAVEAIIAEGSRLDAEDKGSMMEFSLHEFYRLGIGLAECGFTGEKLSLAKKLMEIRGW